MTPEQIAQIKQIFQDEFQKNYSAGVPRVPPHTHNGVDNLQIQGSDIVNLPSAEPGGVNGDIQINASGSFGTIAGLHLDQTGNTRGTNALDIQSLRTAVTQVASGLNSTALGNKTTASGDYSTAAGYSNTSSGYGSVTFGGVNRASGVNAIAAGYGNTANSKNAIAIGYGNNFGNITAGQYSTAIGNANRAQGFDDVLVGFSNTTSTYGGALAFGISNTVSSGVSGTVFGINLTNSTNGTMQFGLNDSFKLFWSSVGNLGLNGQSFGGGKPVVFIANATTTPTTNPSGGGILYATGGALHWLGSAGTDTPLAPA